MKRSRIFFIIFICFFETAVTYAESYTCEVGDIIAGPLGIEKHNPEIKLKNCASDDFGSDSEHVKTMFLPNDDNKIMYLHLLTAARIGSRTIQIDAEPIHIIKKRNTDTREIYSVEIHGFNLIHLK